MNGQPRPQLDSRPSLPRVGSNTSTAPPPPPEVHVIIRLPYDRPPDAPVPPPQVIWSPEKERILWNELSRSMTNPSAIDWSKLSEQLHVPVPYLVYRAQVRYQEDLRGLQGIRQGLRPSGLPPSTPATSPSDDRLFGFSGQRNLSVQPNLPSSNPLSPSASTPTSARPLRRMSSSGAAGSRLSRLSNGSTHTLVQPSSTTRMAKLNPVLTPLRTAVGSEPSTPGSTPSGTDSEDERQAKEEAQREEADQLAQKLKNLQKTMGSGAYGFAKVRPKPLEVSPAPSVTASQTRSQSATVSLPRDRRVLPGAAMTADASGTSASASASASMSARSSIPDIPSPASDSRARMPVRVSHRAASANTRRSPSNVSEAQERGPGGRVESGHVSSASSFSDLSLTDSALADALGSNNFQSTTGASRMSMLSRVQYPRGQTNVRRSRYQGTHQLEHI